MYSQYKAHVAPIYQTEMERHLFATASFRRRRRARILRSAKVCRQLLRSRWVGRRNSWKAAPVRAPDAGGMKL